MGTGDVLTYKGAAVEKILTIAQNRIEKKFTGSLYDFQKEPTDLLKKVILERSKAYELQRLFCLFGEVGVGKTYMAAYIAKDWLGKLVVVAPDETHGNWLEVMALFGVSKLEICSELDESLFQKKDIADYLVIVDEIHKHVKKERTIQNYSILTGCDATILALTGTPYGKNMYDFSKIALRIAHYDVPRLRKEQIRDFLSKIVPYHGVSISKPVEEQKPRYIVETELLSIKMTFEQRAYYDFMVSRGRQLKVTDYQMAQNTDDFVDFGSKETFVTKRHLIDEKKKTWKSYRYFMGYRAITKSFNVKLDKLKKLCLENSGNILIYVNSQKMLKFLEDEGFPVLTFGDKSEIEGKIHEKFRENNCIVVSTRDVKEGINLPEVDMIIWYQTPRSAVDFEQCNGRMLRGIPEEDTHKKVVQIFSQNTIQEKLANELATLIRANQMTIAKKSEESWEERLRKVLKGVLNL